MNFKVLLPFVALLLWSCQQAPEARGGSETMNDAQLREALIERNRSVLAGQRERISSFIKQNNLTMQRTGTGMHYRFLTGPLPGTDVLEEDYVSVSFSSRLLDGTPLYETSSQDPLEFVVGKDDQVLLGFHELVQLMHPGDSIQALMPSHLAYGVSGDQNRVPTEAVVEVHLKLLNASKQQ